MPKLRHYILLLVIFFIFCSLITWNFFLLDGVLFHKVVLYPNNNPIQVVDAVYHPGETVQGITTFCKRRDIAVEADYFLVDTYAKTYPAKMTRIPVGCYSNKTYDLIDIPKDAYTDTYHIEVHYYAKINAINTVEWTRRTTNFKVVR